MSQKTPIQWCDSTVNPTMGCDGCELWNREIGEKTCYAGNETERFGKYSKGFPPVFEIVTPFPGRMEKASRWKDLAGTERPDKPWLEGLSRLIFVSDMGDSLSAAVPFDFLDSEIIGNVTSEKGLRHRWLWLTKRPLRMAGFSSYLSAKGIAWPNNLWAGTSVTSQANVGRVKDLLKVGDESTVRFLSVEPQRGPIDLGNNLSRLDWVIQGGESGRKPTRFDVEWAVEMRERCRKAGVPYFLKQLGANAFSRNKRLLLKDSHGGDWSEWPKKLRVRQMPKAARAAIADQHS